MEFIFYYPATVDFHPSIYILHHGISKVKNQKLEEVRLSFGNNTVTASAVPYYNAYEVLWSRLSGFKMFFLKHGLIVANIVVLSSLIC